jgi:hypothetical protein
VEKYQTKITTTEIRKNTEHKWQELQEHSIVLYATQVGKCWHKLTITKMNGENFCD